LGQQFLTETSQVIEKEVEFTNHDDVVLSGTLFSAEDGEIAVVLTHSGVPGEDQTGLHPFARVLAEGGFTSLTFDFQGFGKTGGRAAFTDVDKDAGAAIAFLRNQGFSRIICMGVGLGGIACAKSGRESDIAGMVLISSPTDVTTSKLVEDPELRMVVSTLEVEPEDMASPGYPKLIIVAEEDFAAGRPFAEMAQTLYDISGEPKTIKVFSGSYHSMQLFRSEHWSDLHDLLMDFFEELR
jgi:esterase/lipase